MRFVNLKNKQALFEKDERLIFKRFAKICLLSKQISMKTSLWDFSSLLEKSKVEIGTFKFVPLLSTLFALRCVVSLVVYSLVPPFYFGSGEGGWDFFHFLMDVVIFYPPRCTPNPFSFHPCQSMR